MSPSLESRHPRGLHRALTLWLLVMAAPLGAQQSEPVGAVVRPRPGAPARLPIGWTTRFHAAPPITDGLAAGRPGALLPAGQGRQVESLDALELWTSDTSDAWSSTPRVASEQERLAVARMTTPADPPVLTSMYGKVARTPSGRLVVSTRTAPVISAGPHHSGFRDVAQGGSALSYVTPAYISMDEERSVALFYASGQAQPTGFVQVDATDNSATPPNRMSIRLRRVETGAWVTFSNGTTQLFYGAGSGTTRLAAQFDAAGYPTAAHSFDVVVRSYWPDQTFIEAAPVRVRIAIINERSSRYGRGWTLPGIQQLVDQGDGVFITHGDGTAVWYPGTRANGYTRPSGEFSNVTFNGVGWDRTYPDGTVLTFGWSGYLDLIRDRLGNEVRLSYDTSVFPHRISAIRDPVGRQITFGYASPSALAWIRDPGGRQVNIGASGARIATIRDPDSVVALTIAYSGDRVLDYWTRGAATVPEQAWRFDYDVHGQVSAVRAPEVATTDAGSTRPRTQLISLEGAVLPASGTGSSSTPAARVRPADVRVQYTTPRGSTTRMRLDRYGLPTLIEEPLGRTTQVLRDGHGRDTLLIAPSGHRVRRTYSGANLSSVVDVTTGRTVNYAYGPHNQLRRISGDTPEVLHFLNSLGLADSTRVGGAGRRATQFAYQSHQRWRLLRVTDPEGHSLTFNYDTYDNVSSVSVSEPGALSTVLASATFDTFGRVRTLSTLGGPPETIWFNSLNQADSSRTAQNEVTRYSYHGSGVLSQLRDSKGQTYRWNYDSHGRTTSAVDPAGRTTAYRYDRSGNLTSVTGRRNQVITIAYDELDRIRTRTADGLTTTWSYGTAGQSDRWLQVQNNVSTDRFDFDAAGRVTQVRTTRGGATYTQTSSYNVENRRTQLSVSGPGFANWTTRWTYNGQRQLERITDRQNLTTTLQYDWDGNRTTATLPNGNHLSTPYNEGHLPRATRLTAAQLDTVSMNYEYASGRVRERVRLKRFSVVVPPGRTHEYRRYTYDHRGRLTSYQDREESEGGPGGPSPHGQGSDPNSEDGADGSAIVSGFFSYDAVGNPPSGVQVGNRLVSYAGFTMEYDLDGNLTRKYAAGYDLRLQWNSLGQLTRSTFNGTVRNYHYDGLGRWAKYDAGDAGIDYIHDGDHLLLERDNPSGMVTEYTYYPGVDEPHSIRRGSSVHYYFTDHPGNVVALVRADGTLANRYHYSPFGRREPGTTEAHPNAFQFQARHFDPTTGLYQFRARWYDPHVGRFISEDPIGLAGGINPYVYADNDPVNLRDPYGLCPTRGGGWGGRRYSRWCPLVVRGRSEFPDPAPRSYPGATRRGPGERRAPLGGEGARPRGGERGIPAPSPYTWGHCAAAGAAFALSFALDAAPVAGVGRMVVGGARMVVGATAASAARGGFINVAASSADPAIASGAAYFAGFAATVGRGHAQASLGAAAISPGRNLDVWGHDMILSTLVGSALQGSVPTVFSLLPFYGTYSAGRTVLQRCFS